jgi:predicted nuclease of predicted toxin-antitoxin system
VPWIADDDRGADDRAVMARARYEDRILLTFDTDFGGLIFRDHLPAPPGVVLVRLPEELPWTRMAAFIQAALLSRSDWEEAFSVVGERRLRRTPLPPESVI